jgi:hypothetical protein
MLIVFEKKNGMSSTPLTKQKNKTNAWPVHAYACLACYWELGTRPSLFMSFFFLVSLALNNKQLPQ